jgi:hypothetical protein
LSDEAASPSLDELRARLDELRAAGARGHDPPGFDFAASLVARAGELGGGAGTRLLARAAARTEQIARELAAVRARADARLARLGDRAGRFVRAFEQGDFASILRAARRASVSGAPPALDPTWLARLRDEARTRGVRPGAGPAKDDRAEVHLLATALYEASRVEAEATRTVLHAEADLPADPGPYNPLALAVGLLGELSTLSPPYLAALVAELTELAPLLALPLPPPPEMTPRASVNRRPRRARKA